MTDLSPHLPYGDISQLTICRVEVFLHMTICHVEKFLHMAEFFSKTSGCDGCDKYQVCTYIAIAYSKVYSCKEKNNKQKYMFLLQHSKRIQRLNYFWDLYY